MIETVRDIYKVVLVVELFEFNLYIYFLIFTKLNLPKVTWFFALKL